MKIARRDHAPGESPRLDAAITDVLQAGVAGRVCGSGCAAVCRTCGSTGCQCMCADHCPDAPRALSDDPGRHPVEPAILPLVFEMKRLGLFQPCWSCEGHLRPDGTLWRVPSVWFYCGSQVHLRLLADAVAALGARGRLRASWHITVTHSDPDNPDTTFCLEPRPSAEDMVDLAALRADVVDIAGTLRAVTVERALALQRAAVGPASRPD